MAFRVNGEIDSATLAQLEVSGIGERTAEGYGQVRFNPPLLTKAPTDWLTVIQPGESSLPSGNATPIHPNDPALDFARLLERECWKQEIRRASLRIAGSSEERRNLLDWRINRESGTPPMSQLGGLRGQLALLRNAVDRQQVIKWLDHLDKNKRRKDRWPSIPTVKAIIGCDKRIWEIIDTNGWPTLTEAAAAQLCQELWPFAVRCFFDACIRAHKRELEVQQQGKEAVGGT